MTLDKINTLLSGKKINNNFLNIASLLIKRISDKEIKSFEISKNIYPASHYLDICSSRMDYIKKKQAKKPSGLEQTIGLLRQFNGSIRIGYIISKKKEKFALYFQHDLNKIVALYYTDHIEPTILDGETGGEP